MEIETFPKQKQLVVLWWFLKALREMEPGLVRIIHEFAIFEKIHACPFPMCFHICAPRSKCLSVITDAIKHHRRTKHGIIKPNPQRIPPARWPDGKIIRCETGALRLTGCGDVFSIDDPPKFYDHELSIEEAFAQGVKAVCSRCYWG